MIRVAIAAAFLLATPAAAETLSGLPYLTDADTVIIHGTRIRLAGIDAPEMAQTCLDAKGLPYRCGEAAREALTAFAAGKEWRCELQARPDRYGRRVGTCAVGGADIQRWLVRSGWALDWPRFSHGRYAKDEAEARATHRGLWPGAFIAPWHVRYGQCGTRVFGDGPVAVETRKLLCDPATRGGHNAVRQKT